MAEEDDKTEEPTARKLEQARKRGEIIYSPEVATWMVLAGGALALAMMGPAVAGGIGRMLIGFFAAPEDFSTDPRALLDLFTALTIRVGAVIGLVLLFIAAGGLAARFVQDQPTWATEKLSFSLDKLDPVKDFQRVFGPAGFSSLLKGLLKLVIVGAAGAWALWPRDAMYETQPLRDLATFWPLVQERAGAMIMACLTSFALIAAGDYFFTRQSYMKKMRMSRQELREEFRQAEGDPQVRAKIRQVRSERARRRMIAAVPKATLVVTNPTHFAVALRYEAGETAAPICVAKGVDEIAFKIRETAEAHSIPIVEDPPLARALYASAELDEPIPRQHYEAVAKTISYVLRLAARRRSRPREGDRSRP
jgi:flagellar biosynthetic protein FlhB